MIFHPVAKRWRKCAVKAAVFAFVLVLLLPAPGQEPALTPAQEDATPPSAARTPSSVGMIYLRIVNSRTGTGVTPRSIEVDGLPLQYKVAEGSLLSLSCPAGDHEFTFNAEGFSPITVTLNVEANLTPITEIEMDPEEPSEDQAVSPDAALLQGNISDIDTAAPVAGAEVTLAGAGLTTSSAADGSFSFEIVTGVARSGTRQATTVEVAADGYVASRLKNVALDPGGRTRIAVKLSRSTTATLESAVDESDEAVGPGADFAQGWTFDVAHR